MKYSKKQILVSFIAIIGLIYLSYYIFPSQNEALCREEFYMFNKSFNGIVTKKYIDSSQHNYPIVEYRSSNEQNIKRLNLSLESGFLYNFLQKGDYIEKPSESLAVTINDSLTARINYGVNCDWER